MGIHICSIELIFVLGVGEGQLGMINEVADKINILKRNQGVNGRCGLFLEIFLEMYWLNDYGINPW